jgi:hypothetical protein
LLFVCLAVVGNMVKTYRYIYLHLPLYSCDRSHAPPERIDHLDVRCKQTFLLHHCIILLQEEVRVDAVRRCLSYVHLLERPIDVFGI